MTLTKEKEIILTIVNLVKDMPYLWNKNDEYYNNKVIRNQGFESLLEVYKQADPNATLRSLKKKLENMRTNYYREYNKVKASENSNRVYEPTLWYYDAYSFLVPTIDPSRTTGKITTEDNEVAPSSEDEVDSQSDSTGVSKNTPSKKKIKISNGSVCVKQEKIVYTSEKPTLSYEDADIIGRAIGIQLRDLRKDQLGVAQKLISDVIFFAKRGRLNDDSVIVASPVTEFYNEDR